MKSWSIEIIVIIVTLLLIAAKGAGIIVCSWIVATSPLWLYGLLVGAIIFFAGLLLLVSGISSV